MGIYLVLYLVPVFSCSDVLDRVGLHYTLYSYPQVLLLPVVIVLPHSGVKAWRHQGIKILDGCYCRSSCRRRTLYSTISVLVVVLQYKASVWSRVLQYCMYQYLYLLCLAWKCFWLLTWYDDHGACRAVFQRSNSPPPTHVYAALCTYMRTGTPLVLVRHKGTGGQYNVESLLCGDCDQHLNFYARRPCDTSMFGRWNDSPCPIATETYIHIWITAKHARVSKPCAKNCLMYHQLSSFVLIVVQSSTLNRTSSKLEVHVWDSFSKLWMHIN